MSHSERCVFGGRGRGAGDGDGLGDSVSHLGAKGAGSSWKCPQPSGEPELLRSVYSYLRHHVVGKALLEAGEWGKYSTWHCPGDLCRQTGRCQQAGNLCTQRTPERGTWAGAGARVGTRSGDGSRRWDEAGAGRDWAEPGTGSFESSLQTHCDPQSLLSCLGCLRPSSALLSRHFCF